MAERTAMAILSGVICGTMAQWSLVGPVFFMAYILVLIYYSVNEKGASTG